MLLPYRLLMATTAVFRYPPGFEQGFLDGLRSPMRGDPLCFVPANNNW